MKLQRLMALTLGFILVAGAALAGVSVTTMPLRDTSKVKFDDYALTSGVKVTSDTVSFKGSVGYATIFAVENKEGGAGDVDIAAEYSYDSVHWYRAYVSDMAGTITVEGNIVTALTNDARMIVFTPRLSKNIRFTFDPDADSKVTATLTYQEEY